MISWNSNIFQLHLKFLDTIWTFENIRHILNAQLEFQHFSNTSEMHWCTSEIFRHASDVFSRYHKTIWIDQLLHYNFQTYFQPTDTISNNIPMYLKFSDVKCYTVDEKVLQFWYFSHNIVSVEIIFEQKYYNFQTFCCSSVIQQRWKIASATAQVQNLHVVREWKLLNEFFAVFPL